MVSLRAYKPGVLEDIKKIHGLLIPLRLHIWYIISPFASLLLADFSWLLYNLIPVAIKNILTSVDTVFSSKTLSVDQPWIQTQLVVFPHPDLPVRLGILIYSIFPIISEMPTIPVRHVCPAKWYTFYYFHNLGIHQGPNCLWVPSSRIWVANRVHYKVRAKVVLVFICWSRASGWEPWVIPYEYRWSWSHPFN